jgi:hypothetical protein
MYFGFNIYKGENFIKNGIVKVRPDGSDLTLIGLYKN